MIIRFIMSLMLLVSLAGLARAQDNHQASNSSSPFRIILVPEREYFENKKISFHVLRMNLSEKPIIVGIRNSFIEIVVKDSYGNLVPEKPGLKVSIGGGPFDEVAPGEINMRSFLSIDTLYALKPGEYTVQVEEEYDGSIIKSNVLDIVVHRAIME